MATTVEITMGDDGTFTVGMVDQPSADVDDQQQVGSIDQALKMAGHLLQNPPADSDDQSGGAADAGGGAAGAAGGSGDGAQAQPASTGGGAAQPSAQDMWNQMAQQGTPPH